jgi:fatty-acid desaturase
MLDNEPVAIPGRIMSMNKDTQSWGAENMGDFGLIRHILGRPITQFLNDPEYLLANNKALAKLYAIVLIPLIALHLSGEFLQAEPWYLWGIAVFLILPHFGVGILVSLLYLGVFLWDGTAQVSIPIGSMIVLAGIYFGIVTAALMHLVAHRGIKPRWLNSLVGEVCALQQLVGVAEWAIPHVLYHHRYSDDPENDPHPPEGTGYLRYALNMKFNIAMFLAKAWFRKWGQTKEMEKLWQRTGLSIMGVSLLRASVWFLLLGPTYFLLFYIPSYLASMLLYTHFNYFTHRPDENGNYVPINCENRGFIFILNKLTFGAYYHKNHHDNPGLFNPKYLPHNP